MTIGRTLAAAALVATLSDWRSMWLASAGLAVLAAVAVAMIVPADTAPSPTASRLPSFNSFAAASTSWPAT